MVTGGAARPALFRPKLACSERCGGTPFSPPQGGLSVIPIITRLGFPSLVSPAQALIKRTSMTVHTVLSKADYFSYVCVVTFCFVFYIQDIGSISVQFLKSMEAQKSMSSFAMAKSARRSVSLCTRLCFTVIPLYNYCKQAIAHRGCSEI